MPGLVPSAARDLPHAILVLTPRGKNSDTHFTDEETGLCHSCWYRAELGMKRDLFNSTVVLFPRWEAVPSSHQQLSFCDWSSAVPHEGCP